MKTGKPTYDKSMDTLKENLQKLMDALDWKQHDLANALQVGQSAVSGYLSRQNNAIPDLKKLMKLLENSEIKELSITLDDLIYNNDIKLQKKKIRVRSENDGVGKILGQYYAYFYNQTSFSSDGNRKMRYGVFQLYENNTLNEEKTEYRVLARFFKNEESDKHGYGAADFFEKLQSLTKTDNVYLDDMKRIKELFRSGTAGDESYEGAALVSSNAIFLHIISQYYSDDAHIILPRPTKRVDTPYLGGLGLMNSVTRGENKLPACQKIILSRMPLDVTEERIGTILQQHGNRFQLNRHNMLHQADIVLKLFDHLLGESSDCPWLEEDDKYLIVENRLNALINDYIKNQIDSVTYVTVDDDKEVYRLIQDQFKKKKQFYRSYVED